MDKITESGKLDQSFQKFIRDVVAKKRVEEERPSLFDVFRRVTEDSLGLLS